MDYIYGELNQRFLPSEYTGDTTSTVEVIVDNVSKKIYANAHLDDSSVASQVEDWVINNLNYTDTQAQESSFIYGIDEVAGKPANFRRRRLSDINPIEFPDLPQSKITNLVEDLSDKVDKETGKGLSSNDYSNEEKAKLAGIEAGANNYVLPAATISSLGGVRPDGTTITVNEQGVISGAQTYELPIASSETLGGIKVGENLSINSSTGVLDAVDPAWASILNKPFSDLGEGLSVTNDTLSVSNKVDHEISSSNGTALIFNEIDGGGAKFEHADGLESFVGVNDGGSSGIAAQIYADKLVNGKWQGAKLDVKNEGIFYTVGNLSAADRDIPGNELAVKANIPTAVSQLSNDSGFITKLVDDLVNYYTKAESYTKAEVDSLISAIKQFTYTVAAELPEASEATMYTIYLVPASGGGAQDTKDEFITIRSGEVGAYTYTWEQIGSTRIDLSNYYTKTEVNTLLNTKQDTLISGTNIKTINNQSLLGNENIVIKTYEPFPEGTIHASTLEDLVDIIFDTFDHAQGKAYLGEVVNEYDEEHPNNVCLPTGIGNAEVTVCFNTSGIAILTCYSSNVYPYHWECNTAEIPLTWRAFLALPDTSPQDFDSSTYVLKFVDSDVTWVKDIDLNDMTVEAHASLTPTVTKTITDDVLNLDFGLPKGDPGEQGPQGDTGPQGPQGDPGNVLFATFEVDFLTGNLIETIPEGYSGIDFAINNNGCLEVAVNVNN